MYTAIYKMDYPVNENQRTIGNTSFADMIAQAQVVTDIDNSIATLTTSLAALSSSTSAESKRAIASENSLTAFITAEAARAAFAETGIKATVVVETARAKAAEVVLTTAVAALQAAPSTSAQDYTMTSWFFGDGSFGSQYVRDERSLNINIRVYRAGNQVTLTLYAGRAASNGGCQAIYCDFLPAWAHPPNEIAMPFMMFSQNIMSPGYMSVSATGSIRMELIWNIWGGIAGLAYDTCVTYLV